MSAMSQKNISVVTYRSLSGHWGIFRPNRTRSVSLFLPPRSLSAIHITAERTARGRGQTRQSFTDRAGLWRHTDAGSEYPHSLKSGSDYLFYLYFYI